MEEFCAKFENLKFEIQNIKLKILNLSLWPQDRVCGLIICFCFTSLTPNYSRVHKSSDSFFTKILEKPSIVQTQKNLIFQLRQISIFFHEIFMVWSLG